MTPRTFFLGAGFSKALNPAYPTLRELSQAVVAGFRERHPEGPVRLLFDRLPAGLQHDVEQFLTYLHSDWPWKSSVDADLDKALYKALVFEVAEVLKRIKPAAISWDLRLFIHFLRSQSYNEIITLNYDSLIEEYRLPDVFSFSDALDGLDIEIEEPFTADRKTCERVPWIVGEPKKIYASDRRKKLLTAAREWINNVSIDEFRAVVERTSLRPQDSQDRDGSAWPIKLAVSFNYRDVYRHLRQIDDFYPVQRGNVAGEGHTGKTLHLHGSLHWQDTSQSTIRLTNGDGHSSVENLPAIVPPVLDKSRHYSVGRLRAVWDKAHAAIQQTREIVVIGYSFPPTDVSSQFLFRSAVMPSTRIVVVNTDVSIRDRCQPIFSSIPGLEVDYRYAGGSDALQRYILNEILNGSWAPITGPLPI